MRLQSGDHNLRHSDGAAAANGLRFGEGQRCADLAPLLPQGVELQADLTALLAALRRLRHRGRRPTELRFAHPARLANATVNAELCVELADWLGEALRLGTRETRSQTGPHVMQRSDSSTGSETGTPDRRSDPEE